VNIRVLQSRNWSRPAFLYLKGVHFRLGGGSVNLDGGKITTVVPPSPNEIKLFIK